MSKRLDKRDPWLCGYAAALSCVWSTSSHDSDLIRRVLISGGITLAKLRAGGAEKIDLDAMSAAIGDPDLDFLSSIARIHRLKG